MNTTFGGVSAAVACPQNKQMLATKERNVLEACRLGIVLSMLALLVIKD
jgi:hypothetical protein